MTDTPPKMTTEDQQLLDEIQAGFHGGENVSRINRLQNTCESVQERLSNTSIDAQIEYLDKLTELFEETLDHETETPTEQAIASELPALQRAIIDALREIELFDVIGKLDVDHPKLVRLARALVDAERDINALHTDDYDGYLTLLCQVSVAVPQSVDQAVEQNEIREYIAGTAAVEPSENPYEWEGRVTHLAAVVGASPFQTPTAEGMQKVTERDRTPTKELNWVDCAESVLQAVQQVRELGNNLTDANLQECVPLCSETMTSEPFKLRIHALRLKTATHHIYQTHPAIKSDRAGQQPTILHMINKLQESWKLRDATVFTGCWPEAMVYAVDTYLRSGDEPSGLTLGPAAHGVIQITPQTGADLLQTVLNPDKEESKHSDLGLISKTNILQPLCQSNPHFVAELNAADILADALHHDNPQVVIKAAEGLADLGEAGDSTYWDVGVNALQETLHHYNPRVQERAALTLAALAVTADPIHRDTLISILEDALHHDNPQVVEQASIGLIKLGRMDDSDHQGSIFRILGDALVQDEDPYIAFEAVEKLGNLAKVTGASHQTEIINSLNRGLRHNDPRVVAEAAEKLSELNEIADLTERTKAIETLEEALFQHDRSWIALRSAEGLSALVKMVDSSHQGTPFDTLENALQHDNPQVVITAARALGRKARGSEYQLSTPLATDIFETLLTGMKNSDYSEAAYDAAAAFASSETVQALTDRDPDLITTVYEQCRKDLTKNLDQDKKVQITALLLELQDWVDP